MNWYKKAELKNTDDIIYDIYKSIEGSVGGNWTVKPITDSKNSKVHWLQRMLTFALHGKDVIKQGDSFSVYVRMWIKRASGKVIHPWDGSYEGSSGWGEGQFSKPTGDLEEQNTEIHKRWQALYNMTPEDASIYDSEYGNRLFDIQVKLFGSKPDIMKESPYEQISMTSELDTPTEIAEHVKTEINRYYFGGDDENERVEPIDPTGEGYMEPEVTYDQTNAPALTPNFAQHKSWYKKAQIEVADSEKIKGKRRHYTGTGHDINYQEQNKILGFDPNENYSTDDPNIMWIYNNEQIETRIETEIEQTHRSEGNWGLSSHLDKLYTGRYSPSEKVISIISPHEGMSKFREIPSFIQRALRQKFPEAKQMIRYK